MLHGAGDAQKDGEVRWLVEEYLQEKYARGIEIDLREQERIAAQLAGSKETYLDELLAEADREIAAGRVFDLSELLKPQ